MIRADEDRVAQEQWAAYETWQRSFFPTPDSVAYHYGTALEVLDPDVPWETVARQAAARTREYFTPKNSKNADVTRWRMTMYAPLYAANYCSNVCRYCGFRAPEQIVRRHLTPDEAVDESYRIAALGFRHQLLLTGEDPLRATTEYLCGIIRRIAERGRDPSVEIPPQSVENYAALADAGTTGVTLYQETYDETLYADYHPHGPKSHYRWRFGAQERGLAGGLQRAGLGFLVGLAPPRAELIAMLTHAMYLREKFPDRTLSFGLPRIREAPAGFTIPYPASDELFCRMYAALRIALPDAELVISVREPAELRNRLCEVCLTQISAGSRTSPGGYAPMDDEGEPSATEQFPVTDHRSPAEVAGWLRTHGFEVDFDDSVNGL